MTRTPLPTVVWRPLYEWSDPLAETLYYQLLDQAEQAARQAAKPHQDEAARLFSRYTRPAPHYTPKDKA